MKPNLTKYMPLTVENLTLIGKKIEKTQKKKRLLEMKRNAFHKMRNRNKINRCGTQLKISPIPQIMLKDAIII